MEDPMTAAEARKWLNLVLLFLAVIALGVWVR